MEALRDASLVLPPGYSSGEEESRPAPQTGAKVRGERTVRAIFEHAEEDRRASRNAWDNHEIVSRTPGTQYQRELYSAYIEAFMLSVGER